MLPSRVANVASFLDSTAVAYGAILTGFVPRQLPVKSVVVNLEQNLEVSYMNLDQYISEVGKQIINGAKAVGRLPNPRIEIEVHLAADGQMARNNSESCACVVFTLMLLMPPNDQAHRPPRSDV